MALLLSSTQCLFRPGAGEPGGEVSLPRVLVIGDSISFQYRPVLKKRLEGKARVFWLAGRKGKRINAGDTKRAIGNVRGASLEDWLSVAGGDWDVITFNYGLHDVKFAGYKMTNKQVCSPEEYRLNLEYIVERLRATGARLVWVRSTPLPGKKEGPRIPGDAAIFNAVADRVLAKYPEILEVDLFRSNLEHLDQQDMVHYRSPEGCERAAGLVAEAVEIVLDQLREGPKHPWLEEDTKEGKPSSLCLEERFHGGRRLETWKRLSFGGKGGKVELVLYKRRGAWIRTFRLVSGRGGTEFLRERTVQVWGPGGWRNYRRTRTRRPGKDGRVVRLLQEWRDGAWKDTWKSVERRWRGGSFMARKTFAMVKGRWLEVFEEKELLPGGRLEARSWFTPLGRRRLERYRFSYSRDGQGRVKEVLGKRFYGGNWVKSFEFSRKAGGRGPRERWELWSWFEGKNDWVEVYRIERLRDEGGRLLRVRRWERIVGLGEKHPPLMDRRFRYDGNGRIVEERLSLAVRREGRWTSIPAWVRTCSRGGGKR